MKQIYFVMFFVFVLLASNASATTGISTTGDKILSPGVIMLLLGDDPKDEDDPGEVNEWEIMAPLPEARAFHSVVADSDGYLYAIGGTSDAQTITPTNTLFRYNTANNTWDPDPIDFLPNPLIGIDAEIINGKIYVPGDSSTADTYVYDITQDTWAIIPAGNGYKERVNYRTVAIGTDLYVLGGLINVDEPDESTTSEVWILDTQTKTWSEGVPMQQDRMNFAAGAINGVLYVAGGVSMPGFNPIMSGEKLTSDEWSFFTDIPDGGGNYLWWAYMADGSTEDALWLAGGKRDISYTNTHVGFYNPAADEWTDSTFAPLPTLNQGRSYLSGAIASNGYFYAIGGFDQIDPVIFDNNERFRVK